MTRRLRRVVAMAGAAAWSAAGATLHACPICFRIEEGPVATGVRVAVVVLVGVTIGVLAGFGRFACRLARADRAAANPPNPLNLLNLLNLLNPLNLPLLVRRRAAAASGSTTRKNTPPGTDAGAARGGPPPHAVSHPAGVFFRLSPSRRSQSAAAAWRRTNVSTPNPLNPPNQLNLLIPLSSLIPPAASAHAGDVDFVLALVHGLMLALFVGWAAYFGWVLVRFRRGRQPRASYAGATGRFALGVEIGVVIAEAVLLVGFALPLWFARTTAAPSAQNPIVLRVIAEQFAWNVHYPGADGQFGTTSIAHITDANPIGLDRGSPFGADDILLVGEMHLPVNRPVIIQLSSKDVIHSFGVPAMRVKQDAIPGLLSPIWFTPTKVGQYEIVCSQLCGLGHYRMRGVITVESEDAFRAYMAAQAALLK